MCGADVPGNNLMEMCATLDYDEWMMIARGLAKYQNVAAALEVQVHAVLELRANLDNVEDSAAAAGNPMSASRVSADELRADARQEAAGNIPAAINCILEADKACGGHVAEFQIAICFLRSETNPLPKGAAYAHRLVHGKLTTCPQGVEEVIKAAALKIRDIWILQCLALLQDWTDRHEFETIAEESYEGGFEEKNMRDMFLGAFHKWCAQNEEKKPRLVAAVGFISHTKDLNNRRRKGQSRKKRGHRNREGHSVWVTESEGPCADAEIPLPPWGPQATQLWRGVQRPDMESAASATNAPMEAAEVGPKLLLPESDPEITRTRSCSVARARPMAPRPPPLPGCQLLELPLTDTIMLASHSTATSAAVEQQLRQMYSLFSTTPPQHQQESSCNHSAGSQQGSKSTSTKIIL